GTDLAIVAAGDIVTGAGGPYSIDTSFSGPGGTRSGGTITLIAGANFTATDNTNNSGTTSGSNGGSGDSGAILTLKGASSTGGMIDLPTNGGIGTFTSAGTGNSDSGGNITLIAYAGTSGNSGSITLPSSVTVFSNGSAPGTPGGAGNDGSVTMIAG